MSSVFLNFFDFLSSGIIAQEGSMN